MTRTFQVVKPFSHITVLQNVLVGALNRIRDVSKAKKLAMEAIEFIGLDKKKDQMATNLSPPERKRLELARALATQPNLILLDEVMAGLRSKEIEEIIRLIQDINKKGITIHDGLLDIIRSLRKAE